MSDITLYLIAAITLVFLILLGLTYLIRRRSATESEADAAQRPRGVPIEREGAVPPRRGGRNVRARMRIAAARQDEEEEEEDTLADEIAMPEGKIGAKKRKKLELKAEKRLQRERELEEREERKQRQQELEERRKREDEKEKEERAKQEEEDRLLKEEHEKKELEEYLKLKEAFSVEEEGYEEEANEEEQAHKFQEFINYIKEKKVVLLEDLAAQFKLKTQDAIDRVQELLAQEWLVGVIDDRGKFIYITKEELESVAQFMRQRGRVSISELVECSNTLINLQPDTVKSLAATS